MLLRRNNGDGRVPVSSHVGCLGEDGQQMGKKAGNESRGRI